MYNTVEAHLDNGSVTSKDLHALPKHALVLLTILKADNDADAHQKSLSVVVARTAGVMHERIDTVKWQRDARSEWHLQ